MLSEINPEVVAWLYFPDLEINLPVVRTEDNSYYLKHRFDRTRNDAGTLFADYRNTGDFSDRHTIIYGHARKDRHMFGNLKQFEDASFCEAHPHYYLYTPGHRYRMEIVAVGDTRDASPFYTLPAGEKWDELLRGMIDRSPYAFGISESPEDRYVTLSTCAYDYEEEQWLVIARIVEPDEMVETLMNDSEL